MNTRYIIPLILIAVIIIPSIETVYSQELPVDIETLYIVKSMDDTLQLVFAVDKYGMFDTLGGFMDTKVVGGQPVLEDFITNDVDGTYNYKVINNQIGNIITTGMFESGTRFFFHFYVDVFQPKVDYVIQKNQGFLISANNNVTITELFDITNP